MDDAARFYGPAQPGTSNATLYTVPDGYKAILRNLHFCNTTASGATISLAINGTAATAANCLYEAFPVAADSAYPWPCFIVLEPGDTLQGLQGTGSAITLTISGVLVEAS